MMPRFIFLLFLLSAMAGGPLFAADNENPHKHPFKGPNGGVVEHIGPYHGELVMGGASAVLFLKNESGGAVDLSNARANVVVMQGNVRRGSYSLSPSDGNRLTGRTSGVRGDKAVVTVVLADGTSVQGGYRVRAGQR